MRVKKQDESTIKVFLSEIEFAEYLKNNAGYSIKTSIKKALYELIATIRKVYSFGNNCDRVSVTLKNAEGGYDIDITCISKNNLRLKTAAEYRIIFENSEQMIQFVCNYCSIFNEIPECTLYLLEKYQAIIRCNQRKLDFLSKYGFICINTLYSAHLKEYGKVICTQKNIGQLIAAFKSDYSDRYIN